MTNKECESITIGNFEDEIKRLVDRIDLDKLSNYKFDIKDILKDKSKLSDFKEKPGVYVFFKDDKVVYVGKTRESHGLANRIRIQLQGDPTNSNLGKNIDEIENNNKCKKAYELDSKRTYKKCLKNLIVLKSYWKIVTYYLRFYIHLRK